MTAPVCVIGGGSFGTTIANVGASHGHSALIYARSEETVHEINNQHTNTRYFGPQKLEASLRATTDLKLLANSSRLLFLMVPSKAFRTVLRELAPHITAEHMIVHGTKGVERDSFKTMSALIREETCCKRIGALAGPNLAKEILDNHPTGTVIASRFSEVIEAGAEALSRPNFLVFGNHDLLGVELGGALKNILAIGAGMTDGAGFGSNAKSLVMTRGLRELMRFGESFGAEPRTFSGLSGIGDIIATCSSPLSRNYQVGLRIGKGETLADIMKTMQQVAEGVDMIDIVHQHAQRRKVVLPLISGLYRVVFGGEPISNVQRDVMGGHALYEIDPAWGELPRQLGRTR